MVLVDAGGPLGSDKHAGKCRGDAQVPHGRDATTPSQASDREEPTHGGC